MQRKDKSEHGDSSKLVRLIRGALEYGVKKFSISGGEPLQHPDFFEILNACSGGRVVLFSNLYGDQVDDQLIKDIFSQRQIHEVKVSLDGLGSHEKTRPPSTSEDILQKIALVKEVAPECRVTINTTLTRYNLRELQHFQEHLAQVVINHWRIDLPMKSPSPLVYASFREVITAIADVIMNRYKHKHLQAMALTAFRVYKSSLEGLTLNDVHNPSFDDEHPCAYSFGKMAVGVNGRVSICSPLDFEMSQAWDYEDFSDLAAAYSKHPFFQFRQGDIGDCKHCRYYLLCGTGCRGEALEWMGRCEAVDPLSCSIMPLVEEKIIPILSPQLNTLYRCLINESGNNPEHIFSSQTEMSESLTKAL